VILTRAMLYITAHREHWGHAIHEALKELNQLGTYQRDAWHVFEQTARAQGRVERLVHHEEKRLRTMRIAPRPHG
jgi:uncharacterized membrane protein YgaE (UPF0421/DUF939 family)